MIKLTEIEMSALEKDTLLPIENWRSTNIPVYMPETVGFLKFSAEHGLIFDWVDGVKYADLRDDSIWLPVIYIVNVITIPVVLGVLSNYVYDKFKGDKRRAEKCKLHVEVRTPGKNGKTKSISYEGPVNGLSEIAKINEQD